VRHLEWLGYAILERNFRCPLGEVDIVAIQGEYLVFCEVKARRTRGSGFPGEAIHERKQRRMARLAEAYLALNPRFSEWSCRFDAVLLWNTQGRWAVEVIPDAFRPGW
jgi:putative endonuclease